MLWERSRDTAVLLQMYNTNKIFINLKKIKKKLQRLILKETEWATSPREPKLFFEYISRIYELKGKKENAAGEQWERKNFYIKKWQPVYTLNDVLLDITHQRTTILPWWIFKTLWKTLRKGKANGSVEVTMHFNRCLKIS